MNVEKYLDQGETVKYTAKPSFVPVIIPGVISAILLIVGLILANAKLTTMIAGVIMTIVGIVFALFTISQIEIVAGTWVIVTDKRIMMHKGLLKNTLSEIPADKVSGITINQSLFGRIFDYSSVIVESSAVVSGVKAAYIKKPFDLKKIIQTNAKQSN